MGLDDLYLGRVLWLLLLMIIVGCGAETAVPTPTTQPAATMTSIPTERPYRYLALGDSYTIGERVPVADRWPVQLVAALRAQGLAIADPEIIAKTGWTTAELADGIDQAQPQGPYDLVSLLIGVNNQYRGLSQDAYRAEFVELLDTAVAFANNDPNRVFVVSIPDWGVTPFGQRRDSEEVSAAIDAFNAINRTETENRGIVYIDITPISRQAIDNRTLIADDGLHPSGKMYRLWVEEMQPAVCRLLSKN
ncbi:MAG: SGNH/GDSL hydrolase family protein [Ardenticatenaceae bacterium]|nr:SGNH/GDSL hydrolase family protein [Ardenticatenaceae bacterium]